MDQCFRQSDSNSEKSEELLYMSIHDRIWVPVEVANPHQDDTRYKRISKQVTYLLRHQGFFNILTEQCRGKHVTVKETKSDWTPQDWLEALYQVRNKSRIEMCLSKDLREPIYIRVIQGHSSLRKVEPRLLNKNEFPAGWKHVFFTILDPRRITGASWKAACWQVEQVTEKDDKHVFS